MSEQTVAETILRLTIDRQAAANVSKTLTGVQSDVRDLNRELASMGTGNNQGVERLRDRFGRFRKEVEGDIDAIETLHREVLDLGKTKVTPQIDLPSADAGGANRRSNQLGRLGTFGRELKALPAVPIPGLNVSTDQVGKIFQTVDVGLTAVGASAAQAAAAAGIAAPALIGVALAVDNFFKTIDAGKKALSSGLTALDQYYQALRDSTSKQAQEQVQNLNRQLDLDRQQREQLVAQRESAFAQLQDSIGDAAARAAVAAGQTPVNVLDDRIKQLGDTIGTNEQLVGHLNTGLQNNAFIVNDVNAAVEEANKVSAETTRLLDEQTQARFREARQLELSTFQFQRNLDAQENALLRTGSTEGINDRIASIRDETSAIEENMTELRELARTNSLAAEELKKTETRLGELRTEAARLASIRPDVAMRELALATVELNEDLAKLDAGQVAKLGELATKLEDGIAELDQGLIEQEQQNAERRAEELERFDREELERVASHRRNIAAIERRFDSSAKDAIANRDAVAYQAAVDAKKESLAEEEERYAIESEKRAQDLKDLKENLDKQDKETTANYQKRYNALVEQNRREVSALNAKYQADIQIRQSAFNAEAAQLQAAINQEITMRNYLNNAILNGTTLLVDRIQALYSTLGASASNTGGTGGYNGAQTLTAYANGGNFRANQPMVVGEEGWEVVKFDRPGRVLNQRQFAAEQSTGSATINLNVAGATIETIDVRSEKQALQVMSRVVRKLGVRR